MALWIQIALNGLDYRPLFGIKVSPSNITSKIAVQMRTVSSKPPLKGTVIVRNRFLGLFTNSK